MVSATATSKKQFWISTLLTALAPISAILYVWHSMDVRLAVTETILAAHCVQADKLTEEGCKPSRDNLIEIKLLRMESLNLSKQIDKTLEIQESMLAAYLPYSLNEGG